MNKSVIEPKKQDPELERRLVDQKTRISIGMQRLSGLMERGYIKPAAYQLLRTGESIQRVPANRR
jgi:hypothetical protein